MNSTEFLDIGRHCSDDSCRQLDFLPFSCPSCGLPYCGSHWKPDGGHACPSYDPALADNRIPSCPLCSTPVSFPPGTDPNGPMDAHLSSLCPILHPHLATPSSTSSTPTPRKRAPNECRAHKCRTKMVVPIRCDACRASFCPKHRFPSDHACAGGARGPVAAAAAGTSTGTGAGASVKRAWGGLLGSRAASAGAASTSSSGAKKGAAALTPRTASTSTSSSSTHAAAAAAPAPRPPRPAAPPPTRTGLAALRRAQQALSAKPAPPIGSSANPLVLDSSSSSSGDESDVQVVHERPAGAGQAGEAGKGRRASSGAAASAAAGGGRAGGGGGAGGSGSAAKKALASTGLRGAPSKRALQEQESARKALEVRAKKGLLTEDEKVRYATMQALQASGKAKGGDEACVVS